MAKISLKSLICMVLCLGTLFLCACSSKDAPEGLMPMEPISGDLPDSLANEAVRDFLSQTGAPASSSFSLHRYDLNNDGRRDAFVFISNPFGHWCNQDGCALLVLGAGMQSFEPLGLIRPVRDPIFISSERTNDWKDLYARVSGRWDPAKSVVLKFNGATYPSDPRKIPYSSYLPRPEAKIFIQ